MYSPPLSEKANACPSCLKRTMFFRPVHEKDKFIPLCIKSTSAFSSCLCKGQVHFPLSRQGQVYLLLSVKDKCIPILSRKVQVFSPLVRVKKDTCISSCLCKGQVYFPPVFENEKCIPLLSKQRTSLFPSCL